MFILALKELILYGTCFKWITAPAEGHCRNYHNTKYQLRKLLNTRTRNDESKSSATVFLQPSNVLRQYKLYAT